MVDRRRACKRPADQLEGHLQQRVGAAARDRLDHCLHQRARERRCPHLHLPSRLHVDGPLDEQACVFVQPRVTHLRQSLTCRATARYSRVRRNSSMSSAGSVSILVDPRAPSPTETFATVAMSGASTTFTKSNSPSVAHWCNTRQPNSSTSLLTSRSRSGFDLSVVTPCCVSVDRRVKMGSADSLIV